MSQTVSWLAHAGNQPHYLMGNAFSLGNVSDGPVHITGMDLAFVHFSSQDQNYVDIHFDISFWDVASNATSGSEAAFSNRLASYTLHTGPFSTAANHLYRLSGTPLGVNPYLNFGEGFTVSKTTNLGMQIFVRGDNGGGYILSQNLTLGLVNATTGPAVGSFTTGRPGINGAYTNDSQWFPADANTSLLGSDFNEFDLGSNNVGNNGIGFRLFSSPVPEPASMLALLTGVLAVIRRRSRTRRS
jgi:hypothetical protein